VDYKFNENEQIKCPICGESANYREFPGVDALLQQGEKYKLIVDYLEKYCGYYYWGSSDNLSQLIPRLEQKYLEESE